MLKDKIIEIFVKKFQKQILPINLKTVHPTNATASDLLWGNGIQLIAKPRKNMKNVNLSQTDKILLRKQAIIEWVNDDLKNICKLQHTRHRWSNNFLN